MSTEFLLPDARVRGRGSVSDRLTAAAIWTGAICTLVGGLLFLIPLTGWNVAWQEPDYQQGLIRWTSITFMASMLLQITGVMFGLVRVHLGTASGAVRTGVWLAPLLSTALMVGICTVLIFLLTAIPTGGLQ